MTEQEWLVCTDPRVMYNEMVGRISSASNRRWRLLACAIQRARLVYVRNELEYENAINEATTWAETGRRPPSADINSCRVLMEPAYRGVGLLVSRDEIASVVSLESADLFREIIGNPFRPSGKFAKCEVCHGNGKLKHYLPGETSSGIHPSVDIYCKSCFGDGAINTWKSWLTPTVLSIAQQIYDTQDYTGMPILADAIEEAGIETILSCRRCKSRGWVNVRTPDDVGLGRMTITNPCPDCDGVGRIEHPLIRHLRGNSKHVRGCWVLDLILGKE